MPESQEDVDALLAEVSALADEAVSDIAGPESSAQVAPPPAAGEQPAGAGSGGGPAAASQGPAQPAGVRTVSAASGRPRQARCPAAREDPSRILNLQVPVIVRLAERTMPVSEIVNLTSGAIIEFDKPSDGQLDLMINNKCVGYGQAVKVGENFGLRVGTIGSVRDRIQALGGR